MSLMVFGFEMAGMWLLGPSAEVAAGSTLFGEAAEFIVGELWSLKPNDYTGTIGSVKRQYGSHPWEPPHKRPRPRLPGPGPRPGLPAPGDFPDAPVESSPNENNSAGMSDNVIPLIADNVTVNNLRDKLHGVPINHYRALSYLCDGDEGEEKIVVLGSIGTTSQWNISTAAAIDDITSRVRWLDLDPNQGLPAGLHYTARGDAVDQELCLDYVTQIFEFTNFENVPCFCNLSMFKVKDSNGSDPVFAANAAYAALVALPDPPFALPGALSIAGSYSAVGVSATGESLPWAVNFPDTKLFTEWFGKLKEWKFQLPAGGRLCLKIGIKMGMIGSKTELAFEPARPKGSIVSTFSTFGAPVLSSVTEAPVHAHTKVGIIVTSMLKFRHLDKKVASDLRYTQWTGMAANNAIASERFLDTDLDDVSPVIQA